MTPARATLDRPPALEPGRLSLSVRRVEGPGVAAVRAWVPGGARSETLPGQALVTGRALSEGTRRRDWRRIADEAEALGASVSSSASFEALGVTVDARSAHWEPALEWAAELLAEPAFPEDRCRWVARQTAAELESLADQPDVRTAWAFLEQLYAPHPRSRPIQGSAESLAALGPADCLAFHRRSLAGGVCVSVAGAVEEEAVAERVRRLFAFAGTPPRDPAAPSDLPAIPPPEGLAERHRGIELPPGDQAHLFAGCLTVARAHADRHALELLGVVLGAGAGLTGRLPERVREREGLAYSVQVQTLAGAGLDPGRLVVYVGTSPATLDRAERAIVEELARLVDDGVTAREVEEARGYLLGREPFRRETARQWAELLSEAALYGVPEDDPEWRRAELESLDPERVTEAARRHLRPEELRFTVGIPRDE